jgi:SAM-dependent methyltransferase
VAASELDRLNRSTWSRESTLEVFAARDGPIDPGEALLLERLCSALAGEPILDVGVGGGRSVPLLRRFSDDYVGIDYLEEMVSLTRTRFPDARIEHVDARDLSPFADGSFALAFWSANGIDGVSHTDRSRVLSEIRRVLRPGGFFAFSTHNLRHPLSGRPPWHYRWFLCPPRIALLRASRLRRRAEAYRRAASGVQRGQGWGTLVDPAYEFGLLTHFTTLAEARAELVESGFEPEIEAWDTQGSELASGAETRSPWFHLLARTPRRDCG